MIIPKHTGQRPEVNSEIQNSKSDGEKKGNFYAKRAIPNWKKKKTIFLVFDLLTDEVDKRAASNSEDEINMSFPIYQLSHFWHNKKKRTRIFYLLLF